MNIQLEELALKLYVSNSQEDTNSNFDFQIYFRNFTKFYGDRAAVTFYVSFLEKNVERAIFRTFK